MIVLFTDFGLAGPYTGQMKAVLRREAPHTEIIDLFADAPAGDPRASAYLLAAYAEWFLPGTIFLCVVDPGVGGQRAPLMIEADRRWYVGPENGLFELVLRRAQNMRCYEITWQPPKLSASFQAAIFSRRSRRCWRAASGRMSTPAMRFACPAGPMISPRSSISTITATP